MPTYRPDCDLCVASRVPIGSPCVHRKVEGRIRRPKTVQVPYARNKEIPPEPNISTAALTIYKPLKIPPEYRIPRITLPTPMETDNKSPSPKPSTPQDFQIQPLHIIETDAPEGSAAVPEIINAHRTEVAEDVFGPISPLQTLGHQQHSSPGSNTPEIGPSASQSPSTSPDDTRARALALLKKPCTKARWPYGRIPRYLPEGPAELAASNYICPNEGHFPSVIIPLD